MSGCHALLYKEIWGEEVDWDCYDSRESNGARS
jgi:hypothetical protein